MNCRLFAMTLSYGGGGVENCRNKRGTGKQFCRLELGGAHPVLSWRMFLLVLLVRELFRGSFMWDCGWKNETTNHNQCLSGKSFVSFCFVLFSLNCGQSCGGIFFLSLLWPQNGYCQTDRHWSGGVSEWLELFVATLDRKKTDGEWFTGTELCNMKDWWDVGIEGRSIMEGGSIFLVPLFN